MAKGPLRNPAQESRSWRIISQVPKWQVYARIEYTPKRCKTTHGCNIVYVRHQFTTLLA